jgi:hypothetical protein
MSGQTATDNNGHVRRDKRTDNNPLKGLSVRCPVRPSRKEIRETRAALGVMFGLRAERDDLPERRDANFSLIAATDLERDPVPVQTLPIPYRQKSAFRPVTTASISEELIRPGGCS